MGINMSPVLDRMMKRLWHEGDKLSDHGSSASPRGMLRGDP